MLLFNILIPDHDAKVFNPPSDHNTNFLDRAITLLLEGFRRWDAVYYLHIAEHGYTYENTLAFFPLFPLLVRLAANLVFFPLQYVMSYASVLLLSAFIVNLALFVISADVLYRLSERVLGSNVLAYKTAQLYCVNPASIFFSAAYSETTFALLTFYGMLQLEEGRTTRSSLIFSVASLARSNGLVNCGFVMYSIVKGYAGNLRVVWSNSQQGCTLKAMATLTALWLTFWYSVSQIIICVIPFATYQYYAYTVFCNLSAKESDLPSHILRYGNEQKYKMAASGLSEWCHQTIPLSYAYVQKTHWNVGFMEYYRMKQLPNFALATPMIALCACVVVHYFSNNGRYCLTLGLVDGAKWNEKKTDDGAVWSLQYGKSAFVYVVHMVYMVTFGLLFMHVQVLTRFIASSCPIIYWFIASATTPAAQLHTPTQALPLPGSPAAGHDHAGNGSPRTDRREVDVFYPEQLEWDRMLLLQCVKIYFLSYVFIGAGAFSNFLPWT